MDYLTASRINVTEKANKNPEFLLIKFVSVFTDFYVAFNFNVF